MGYRKFATQGVFGGKRTIKHGNYTAFGGLKLYPALLRNMSLADIVKVKLTPGLTISYSPFGWLDEGGVVYVKGAPPLRGMTPEEAERAGGAPAASIRALRDKAVPLSKRHTEKGVVIVNIGGRLKRMPRKAYEMMREGKRAYLIRGVIGIGGGVTAPAGYKVPPGVKIPPTE